MNRNSTQISKIARKYWKYCDTIYLDNKIKHNAGKGDIQTIGSDVMGFWKVDGELIFAFRGSDDLDDWKSNADVFPLTPCTWIKSQPLAMMHESFYLSAVKCITAILQILAQNNSDSVTFLGHSRGGAIAANLADYFSHKTKYKVTCVTYGAPATGDRVYAEIQRSFKFIRVIHGNDLVSRIGITSIARHVENSTVVHIPVKWYSWWRTFWLSIWCHTRTGYRKALFGK